MRSENEVRDKVKKYLDIVINDRDNIDDFDYAQAQLKLNALLWVLEEFDGLSTSRLPSTVKNKLN